MTKSELLERANGLPFSPGVYIMKNKSGTVIYVGKSKVLRQRVSQYFQDTEHNFKTAKMISQVDYFDYMLTDTEMEALALENRLIKLHLPKYNIRLKDDKSYPYIKVTINAEYPALTVTRTREADGARYFGPYSSMNVAFGIVHSAERIFKIANCKRVFPRDIGKERPCMYMQIGQCVGPCSGDISGEDYKAVFRDVTAFLRGSYAEAEKSLQEKMEYSAENLMFENAALYRDRIKSLEALWQKQRAVGAPDADQDVFALYSDELCSCLAVFYVRMGFLADSEFFVFTPDMICDDETLTAFIGELYNKRGYIPKEILIGFEVGDEAGDALHDYLRDMGAKTRLRFPERGDLRGLCDMVYENARDHAARWLAEQERDNKMLFKLAQLLQLEVVPQLIEAYDVSNMGNENIVCGMIQSEDGKLKKSGYRSFNIKDVAGQDDYASMSEAIARRIEHTTLKSGKDTPPDLILLDGGRGHVSTIRKLLKSLDIDIPVFGMVKDEYHKTRALSSDTEDISIAREQPVFQFVYKLQEEVHRYTVTRMTNARSGAVKRSSLEDIKGIGPSKARLLLSHFKTLSAIKAAEISALSAVTGIAKSDAANIYAHFHRDDAEAVEVESEDE